MKSRIGLLALAPLAMAALLPLTAFAQPVPVASPKIIITNAGGTGETAIPLTGTLQVGADGDISVECRLAGGACPNVGSGGSSGTPPTLQLTPSSTSINSGELLTLTWTSSGDVCYGVAPANATGWYQQVLPKSGSKALPSLAVGTYAFGLRCYSAGGSVLQTTPTVTVNTPPTPEPAADYCAEVYNPVPTVAQFTAHGFTRTNKTFEQVFGIPAGGTTTLHSVPRDQLGIVGNNYLSIGFVMTADTGADSQMTLDMGLAQGDAGPSGAVTVTVSPCPGDFRARNPSATSDIYVQNYCRASFGTSGKLNISSRAGDAGWCKAPKNKQMYINIAPRNMYTVPPTANTCEQAGGPCGLSIQVL